MIKIISGLIRYGSLVLGRRAIVTTPHDGQVAYISLPDKPESGHVQVVQDGNDFFNVVGYYDKNDGKYKEI